MKENRIKNLLIVLNIALLFLIIGFLYASFSYALNKEKITLIYWGKDGAIIANDETNQIVIKKIYVDNNTIQFNEPIIINPHEIKEILIPFGENLTIETNSGKIKLVEKSIIISQSKRIPEPIKEAIKPIEKSLEIFNKTDEAVKTAIVNIIPEKETKSPIYINYISNAINIFLHNSLFLLFFLIPITIEYLPSLCKYFKWKIDKRYEKAEKIGRILLIIGLLANLSLNCFYIGLGLRIFGFAFFYFFEFFALIFTVFPIVNYLRNNDFNEYINDLKFSIPLMLSLFFAGAFEESVYLVK